MNDFTKEELQTVDYLIDAYCQHSMPPEGVYAVLKAKIQSRIDNHCAHEPSQPHYEQFVWHICTKCGKQYK